MGSKYSKDIIDELEHAGYSFVILMEENQNHYWYRAINPFSQLVEVRYDIHENTMTIERWDFS